MPDLILISSEEFIQKALQPTKSMLNVDDETGRVLLVVDEEGKELQHYVSPNPLDMEVDEYREFVQELKTITARWTKDDQGEDQS